MKPKTDVLATMSQSERVRATATLYLKMFGPNARPMLEHLKEGFTSRTRQLGDAADPEQNHWRGAWRIYELK